MATTQLLWQSWLRIPATQLITDKTPVYFKSSYMAARQLLRQQLEA